MAAGHAAALPGTFYRATTPLHGPCVTQCQPQADFAKLAMDLLHDTISGTASIAEAHAACSALRDGDLTGALDGLNTSIRVTSEPTTGYLSGRQVRERQRLLNVAQIARVLVLDAIAAALGWLEVPASCKNVLVLVIELMRDIITGTLSIHEAHEGLISGDASGALDAAYRAIRDGNLTGAMGCLNASIQIASTPPKEGTTGRSHGYRHQQHLHERQRLLTVAQIAHVLVSDASRYAAGNQLHFGRLLRISTPQTMAALTARTSMNGFERWRLTHPLDRHHAIEHHCTHTRRPATVRRHTAARAADPARRSDSHHRPAQDKHLRSDERRRISKKHQDHFTRQRLEPVGSESLGFLPCRKRGGWQMRLSIKCAHCGTRSTVIRMFTVTDDLVELTYRCTNIKCGHNFVVAAQTIRTTVLPAVINPAVSLPLSSRIDRTALNLALLTLPTADETGEASEISETKAS
jgi:hypothetical protein